MLEPFVLDPRLEASTVPYKRVAGFDVRLVDDSRWPWVMIVPAIPDVVEITDMSEPQMRVMMKLARNVARVLKHLHPGTGTNIATLGNVVEQFHLHVVARRAGDPNWPGPVWGFGEAQPYGDPAAVIAAIDRAHEAVPELDRL